MRHFAVTWGLPDDFGGMTSVVLRRSAGFAAAGAPVTVLTFDDRLDTEAAVTALRRRGVIADDTFRLDATRPILASAGRLAGEENALEAARTVVAWATGFISMELNGRFQLGGDVDRAWEFGVTRIVAAITTPV